MTTQPISDNIGFWELDLEHEGQPLPVPEFVQPLIYTAGTVDIGIFPEQKDVRIPVNEVDISPGGKYHSIVKLFFRFGASKTWTTATGWLLEDNVVVTAAHGIYNHGERAACVKVCIGYSASLESASVAAAAEQRLVCRVVAPLEWINEETEQHDVAFLQLDSPFQNVSPVILDTPEINARQSLTIVGYPADLSVGGMPGGEMYEMKIDRDINLERTKFHMLVYQGDLKGGFSGAPVIRDSNFAAIGVHVRGGSFNSAAIVGGPYGVNFEAFRKVIDLLKEGSSARSSFEVKVDDARDWLKYVHVPRNSGF